MCPRLKVTPRELAANVPLVISWPAAVSLMLLSHLLSLPVLLLSNGSMVGYLEQPFASKTRKSLTLHVYRSSPDVMFVLLGTTHRRLSHAHSKQQPILTVLTR